MNSQKSQETQSSAKRWRFVRIGGFDHVCIEKGIDIAALDQLDQKLWAALSCPTQGLEFDTKTLQYMDSDGDGRIRVLEILNAVKWTLSLLKNPEELIQSSDKMPLSAINDNNPLGKEILTCAREVLTNLGKGTETAITLTDTADSAKVYAATRFNGDGVIPISSADDDATRTVIKEIMDCVGSEPDRSGLPGITMEKLNLFFTEAQSYSDWITESEKNPDLILPLGDKTIEAAAIFLLIRDKVDDYFTRCNLAMFDSRSIDPLNPTPQHYAEIAKNTLSTSSPDIAVFPLAKVSPSDTLSLDQGLNPAWSGLFENDALKAFWGSQTSITSEEWTFLRTRFNAYLDWSSRKKGMLVEKLGINHIREILSGSSKQEIASLIEKDKSLDTAFNAFNALDKLLHYYRDLFILLNNFVSFFDFYSPNKKAIFQAGTLFLDGRSCDLCIKVHDIASHSTLANLGRTYIAYCECTRKDSSEKLKIAAAFTQGDADNLMVGRNGVFYDRQNRDWDATIVKIIEHPISVRQAFWSPYKRIARMIGEQIEKVASAKDKAVDTGASTTITEVGQKVDTPKTAPVPPFDVGKFAGIFAAIGLAIGAIGTAIASVLTGFLSLLWWQMPLAIFGLMLLISGPSMIVASLKLRQRNLAPILDACGWAINTRAKINIPFGTSLTTIAKLPMGSSRILTDPFAEKKKPWKSVIAILIILIAVIVAFERGIAQKWINHLTTTNSEQIPEDAPANPPVSEGKTQ